MTEIFGSFDENGRPNSSRQRSWLAGQFAGKGLEQAVAGKADAARVAAVESTLSGRLSPSSLTTTIETKVAGAVGPAVDARVPEVLAQDGTIRAAAESAVATEVQDRNLVEQSGLAPLLARSAPPLPLPRAAGLLTRFQPGHNAVNTSGGWHNNTTDYLYGSQSWELVTTGSRAQALTDLEFPAPVDMRGKTILITATFSNVLNVGRFELQLGTGDTGFTNMFAYRQIFPGANDQNKPTDVHPFTWDRASVAAGAPDAAAVRRLRLRVADAGAPLTVRLHEVRIIDSPVKARFPNGVGTIGADDGYASYELMYRVLSKYGVPGTIFMVAENAGREDRLTVGDLKRYQADGWQVQPHAYALTTQDYTAMTEAAIDADMRALKTWLLENGFSADYLAYPQGRRNDTVRKVTARYFKGARTVAKEPLTGPGIRPYELAAYSIPPNHTVQQVTDYIDQCVTAGLPFNIVFHRFEPGGATTVPLSWGADQLDAVVAHCVNKGIALTTYPDIYG